MAANLKLPRNIPQREFKSFPMDAASAIRFKNPGATRKEYIEFCVAKGIPRSSAEQVQAEWEA